MLETNSPRHQLPYLFVTQAQKELTHNEALTRVDALLHPVVQSRQAAPPLLLSSADVGKCWLVDVGGIGEWQDKTNQIALWTGWSWRFLSPHPGMRAHNNGTGTEIVWIGSQWVVAPSVADPQNGSVVDVEARAAIVALLSHFRGIGQVTA